MGIKYLWTILTPFCERKPLYELQGKTVAVDLSCWVCEAQNISEYQVQPRMYLRNLYFRACYLLLMDVYPIFVLEGKAPELKYNTISARNAIQFKGAKPKTDGVKTGKDRTRFHFTLKQCQQMLGIMGLVCLTGKGEAESFCAYLNKEGFVDGCISQDSDCFAYGAKTVYRNFSISSQGSHAASGGAVDVYNITKAEENLNFGREKIIALALLCGSDYCEGVQGVGKDSALKLFEKYTNEEILQRLRKWRNNPKLFEEFENQLNDKNICTSCGHSGKLQTHNKSGCRICGTSSGCDFTKYKNERVLIKNEINVRKKALEDPNFPNEELIGEYLSCKDKVASVDLKWNQPDLVDFIKFTSKYLAWEEVYSFEKFLPILTRWQLVNYEELNNTNLRGILYPQFIKKKRAPKGVPSYEIVWKDEKNFFQCLIPQNQLAEIENLEKFWSTIEPQQLVEKAYPTLVENFIQSKQKPKPKKRTKKACKVDELSESLKNISMSEPVVKKTRKRAPPKPIKKNTKPIDEFLSRRNVEELTNPCTSTPKRSNTVNLNLDLSDDEEDISNLSNIIEGILQGGMPEVFKEEIEKMGYKLVENEENFANDIIENNEENENVASTSFFIDDNNCNDLFEASMNLKYQLSDGNEESDEEILMVSPYVPLYERLLNKMKS